jgi:hypothetical protein
MMFFQDCTLLDSARQAKVMTAERLMATAHHFAAVAAVVLAQLATLEQSMA